VRGRAVRALLACAALLLLLPASASAHARLIGSTPERGAQLERSPGQVVMRFSEAVEISFGAVRVLDAEGNEVQSGAAEHPGGRSKEVAQRLNDALPDGSYTVTFRVVSADSHPIAGGFVFSVGEGGPAPQASVADLIDEGQAGPVTEVAFGIVRGLAYFAMALAVGVLAFALLVWARSLRSIARAGDEWLAASAAFARRGERLLGAAVVIGLVATALGIVLQGATAAGTSFWSALDPDVLRDVLSTRFGTVWGLRLIAWLGIGALLVVPGLRVQVPRLRPASLGATGLVLGRGAPPVSTVLLAAFVGYILLTPALSGHATTQEPVALLLPTDVVHVLAMCVWIGGLVVLVTALPAATRQLATAERTRLLASSLARFSPLALASVIALVASGVVQSIVHLSALSQLWETPFGRAVLIKIALLLFLVALGAHNRQRSLPQLRRLAQASSPPGPAGTLLRRALRAEVALVVTVLAVTAALVSYPPPAAVAGGPFAANTELGPTRLELTVDPAQVGANEIHLYLFDARTGAQYDEVKEFTITATLPDERIGPLAIDAVKAGPGHYTSSGAVLAPGGDWQLRFRARVSEFDEYSATVDVPVR
jgi:copper transport protein